MNSRYHEFTPAGLDPALIILAIVGLAAVIIFAYLVVRIRPVNRRCTSYRSVGSKAAKVSNPHRKCGAAPKDQPGLAIIMPSTSFDWKLALIYSLTMAVLTYHYHGAGIIQLLWNRGLGEGTYLFLTMVGITVVTPIVVWLVRYAQVISARVLRLSTFKETQEKMPVYEEWGTYDRWCRKEFDSICRSLSRKEKRAVRAVVCSPDISEKTKRDRANSFVLAQGNLKKRSNPVEFESVLDSFVEFVYEK